MILTPLEAAITVVAAAAMVEVTSVTVIGISVTGIAIGIETFGIFEMARPPFAVISAVTGFAGTEILTTGTRELVSVVAVRALPRLAISVI